ncbi:MAG: flavin reductase family protein [Actinomycetota bacterium]
MGSDRQVSITPEEFRKVSGRFATGIAVVTTVHGGQGHGMTAHTYASVSSDSTLISVCIKTAGYLCRVLKDSGLFALSFLREDQEAISRHFSDPDRPRGWAQFDGVAYRRGPTGAPIVEGAIASIECRVHGMQEAGDHTIVVGEVVSVWSGDGRPLLYYDGGYCGLPAETECL